MQQHNRRRSQKWAKQERDAGREAVFPDGCGTLYSMPIQQPVEMLVQEANLSVEYAASVRTLHARRSKRGERNRETDIKVAMDKLTAAMKPIRSRLGRLPYEDGDTTEIEKTLREASQALQRERRKLWKMRQHKPKAPGPSPKAPPPPKTSEVFGDEPTRKETVADELKQMLARAEEGKKPAGAEV